MSSYTPQQLRDYIDDLDAVIRQSVVRKTLKEVFENEKNRIVSFEYYLIYIFTDIISRLH